MNGVIYLSKIPPYMRPTKVKQLLSVHATIGRMFLTPESDNVRKKRVKYGGNKKRKFVDGWVEVIGAGKAKQLAETLNNTKIGGKKSGFYHDDLWSIRFLPGFQWSNLGEQHAYERAVQNQKIRQEVQQARKESESYMKLVNEAKKFRAMSDRKKSKSDVIAKDVDDANEMRKKRPMRSDDADKDAESSSSEGEELEEDPDRDDSSDDEDDSIDSIASMSRFQTELEHLNKSRRKFRQRQVVDEREDEVSIDLVRSIFIGSDLNSNNNDTSSDEDDFDSDD